jgi:hypothetical protein
VAAGTRFVVVVNEVNAGTGCAYTLTVDGGSCRPWLNIARAGANRYDLDWTTAALGYRLERTNVLRQPTAPAWVPVNTPPSIQAGRFHVVETNAPPPTNNFYRLRKP